MKIKTNIPLIQPLLIGILPAFIKMIFYKLKGFKVGSNVKFGFGSAIIGKSVEIGNNSKIGFFSVIHANKIKIGRFSKIGNFCVIASTGVEIGEDSNISDNVIIRGIKRKDSLFKMGDKSRVDSHSILDCAKPLVIGDNTGIASHCTILTHGAWLSELDGYPVTFKPVTIGNKVWIGVNVIILSGTNVGDNVVVDVGTRLSGTIPSNCIVSGNPAKIITKDFPRQLKPEEKLKIINKMFAEFTSHLKYFDYLCKQTDLKFGYELTISKSDHIYTLLFISNNNFNIENIKSYDAIISNLGEQDLPGINNLNSPMIINIIDRTRKGSSTLGEEFVRHVSSFGLKFKRVD